MDSLKQQWNEQIKASGHTVATPWSEKARASLTDMASALLRSESRRMEDTAPTASSVLVSSEASSSSVPKQSLPLSSGVVGGSLAFCAKGLLT